MGESLNKLSVEGFKSIRELKDFDLRKLNVLIGGNGAGKSNFVELFRMLRAMVDQDFENYITERGGADGFLYNGPKVTSAVQAHFVFGSNEYRFKLKSAASEKFVILEEAQKYVMGAWRVIGQGNYQSNLPKVKDGSGMNSPHGVGYYVHSAVSSWTVYHFHDTSPESPMRKSEILEHCKRLSPNASNIAPFLRAMRDGIHKSHYNEIVDAVRLVMPFFDDFILDPVDMGEAKKVKLSWKQKGSDYPMQPYHLSDGSIRFICLATALLQPNPPSTIIIDEPELGLHPYAIEILAELIQSTAKRTQVVISTQSPTLVNYFEPEDIVVVNREQGASSFKRLDRENLKCWLDDYSMGDIWQKNIIAGGPSHE